MKSFRKLQNIESEDIVVHQSYTEQQPLDDPATGPMLTAAPSPLHSTQKQLISEANQPTVVEQPRYTDASIGGVAETPCDLTQTAPQEWPLSTNTATQHENMFGDAFGDSSSVSNNQQTLSTETQQIPRGNGTVAASQLRYDVASIDGVPGVPNNPSLAILQKTPLPANIATQNEVMVGARFHESPKVFSNQQQPLNKVLLPSTQSQQTSPGHGVIASKPRYDVASIRGAPGVPPNLLMDIPQKSPLPANTAMQHEIMFGAGFGNSSSASINQPAYKMNDTGQQGLPTGAQIGREVILHQPQIHRPLLLTVDGIQTTGNLTSPSNTQMNEKSADPVLNALLAMRQESEKQYREIRQELQRQYREINRRLDGIESLIQREVSSDFSGKPDCLPIKTKEDLDRFETISANLYNQVVSYLGSLTHGNIHERSNIILKTALADSLAPHLTWQGGEPGTFKLDGTRFALALYATVCKNYESHTHRPKPTWREFLDPMTAALKAAKQRNRRSIRPRRRPDNSGRRATANNEQAGSEDEGEGNSEGHND